MKLKDVLTSVRFWYAVAIAVAYVLEQTNVLPGAYAKTIEIFSALGIAVRTVDRTVDKATE